MLSDSAGKETGIKDILHTLKEWLQYLLSQWKVVILVSILCGGIGLVFAFTGKTVYTATLSFVLEDEAKTGLSGSMGIANQFGIDLGGGGGAGIFSGGNLIELMKSRFIAEKALLKTVDSTNGKLTLAEYYIRFRKMFPLVTNGVQRADIFPANLSTDKFTVYQDSVMALIYGDIIDNVLSVQVRDKKTNVIYIVCSSENQLFSKKYCTEVAKETSVFYIETKTQKSTQNVAILQHQVDSVRNALINAISGAASTNDNTYNLNPSQNIRKTPVTRNNYEAQSSNMILTELLKNLELAQMTLRKETPLIKTIDVPKFPLPRTRPSKKNYLLVGLVFGGMLCSCFLVFRKMMRVNN